MKIETIELAGFASALKALRLPYGKEARSQFYTPQGGVTTYLDQRDNQMVMRTYGGDFNICPEDMNLLKTLIQRGDSHAKPVRGILAYADIVAPIHFWWDLETYRCGHERLFSASTMNTEGKSLHGKALARALDQVPFSREIHKVDFFSYQCLRNIVKQRYNHRKMEFHEFIEWIRTLPLANELILPGLEKELEFHDEFYKQMLEEE